MKVEATTLTALVDRMKAAARANEVVAATNVAPAGAVETPAPTALDETLRVTARRVLAGDFDSIDAVRVDVVQHVVRDRWVDKVSPANLDKLIHELSSTLVEDPEFRKQVDEMLIIAAREMGRE